MTNYNSRSRYVRCINNRAYIAHKDQSFVDYPMASLTIGRVYKVAPPAENDGDMLRIIDNEGEDYLYPADYFEPISTNQPPDPFNHHITIHLDDLTKGILQAEALAAHTSVSALLREWIDERLDLPQ